MTKREKFEMIIATLNAMEVENKAEMIKCLEHEIELLNKKSGKSGETKTQKENKVLKAEMFEALQEIGRKVTVSEFQTLTRFAPPAFSNQKVSAMLNQLAKENVSVNKTTGKDRKSYFEVV
jgi:lantibiotic modifying enzyme